MMFVQDFRQSRSLRGQDMNTNSLLTVVQGQTQFFDFARVHQTWLSGIDSTDDYNKTTIQFLLEAV